VRIILDELSASIAQNVARAGANFRGSDMAGWRTLNGRALVGYRRKAWAYVPRRRLDRRFFPGVSYEADAVPAVHHRVAANPVARFRLLLGACLTRAAIFHSRRPIGVCRPTDDGMSHGS
jgi:hypothetical protein